MRAPGQLRVRGVVYQKPRFKGQCKVLGGGGQVEEGELAEQGVLVCGLKDG